MAGQCRGDYLPVDVLNRIFDFLDYDELFQSMQTCSRWRTASRDHPTFSTAIHLNDLIPGHYNLFVTRLSHKHKLRSVLDLYLDLNNYRAVPANLFTILRSVWPRMREFRIRTFDVSSTLALLTLPSPALYSLEIMFLLEGRPEPPDLPQTFLGGHAPELRRLKLQDVKLSTSAGDLPVLRDVEQLWVSAMEIDSIALIPMVFPKVSFLRISDAMVTTHVSSARVKALQALVKMTIVHVERCVAPPEWTANLLAALPLATIPSLTFASAPEMRYKTPIDQFVAVLDALPGDLSVTIWTLPSSTIAAPTQAVAVNFRARSADGLERSLGVPDLRTLRVPDRVCARIVELEINDPDWDRTCLWMYGLVALKTLRVVFHGRAAFFDLLRRPSYRRAPVPLPFIDLTQFVLYSEDRQKTDVDFAELYAWLRKGTMEPPDPTYQRFQSGGMNISGEATTAKGGEFVVYGNDTQPPPGFSTREPSARTLIEQAREMALESIRNEGFYQPRQS